MVNLNNLRGNVNHPLKCTEYPNEIVYFVESNCADETITVRRQNDVIVTVDNATISEHDLIFS